MLCFIDLGGHERYLKTAVYGLTCMLPDVVLLCVSARAPPPRGGQPGSPGGWGSGDPEGPTGRAALLPRAAREHLAVALALDVPVAVVVTQVLRQSSGYFLSMQLAAPLMPLKQGTFHDCLLCKRVLSVSPALRIAWEWQLIKKPQGLTCRQTHKSGIVVQVDVAPPGVLAATIEEVRAVLGAAAAGAGVAAGVPAGARGAVSTPLVTSEEQVRCCGGLRCTCYGLCLCGHRCKALRASAGSGF